MTIYIILFFHLNFKFNLIWLLFIIILIFYYFIIIILLCLLQIKCFVFVFSSKQQQTTCIDVFFSYFSLNENMLNRITSERQF